MNGAACTLGMLVALASASVTRTAAAQPKPPPPVAATPRTVAVTVVDLAADVAYVTPGAGAGLRAGARVQLGGRALIVIDVTEAAAAVRLDGLRVALGATGVAEIVPPESRPQLAPRATVRPLEAWRGQWPDAIKPATRQAPAPVPLGSARAPGALHAALVLHGRAVVDRGGLAASAAEAAIELGVAPWRERPLAIDLDVSARVFGAGSTGARAPLRVRTAQVRWGDARDPTLALGRLAWASEATGLLDGVRVAGRRGALQLAGFGGVVPDPIDGTPDTGAARFGVDAIWDAPARPWQPRVAVTALGSTWEGTLDERVLLAGAELRRDGMRFEGWGEAQAFDADDPWGASAVELTGAGLAAGWRDRGRRLDLDVTFQRPQRSRRLAAALPAGWLCYPAGITADAPCAGGEWWADVSGSAGLSGARWSVDATGTIGTTHADGAFVDASALVLGELRVLPRDARLLVGGAATRARFVDLYGLELGVASGSGRRGELAVRWRPELVAYTGAIDRFVSHSVAVDGRWRVLRSLDLGGAAIGTLGDDRDALAIISTLAWRPRP